jgi:Spy/CpxP family protein refolding chaperone
MKKLSTFLSLFVLIALFGTASAQNPVVPVNRPFYGAGRGLYAANLNLTADQLTKINDLRTAHYKDILPLRTKLQSKMLELRTLMLQPAQNQSKIVALQKDIADLQQKIQEKALDFNVRVRKVLTPEQLALLPANGRLGLGLGLGLNVGLGYGRGAGAGYGAGAGMKAGYGRGGRGAGRARGRGMGAGMGYYCPYRY